MYAVKSTKQTQLIWVCHLYAVCVTSGQKRDSRYCSTLLELQVDAAGGAEASGSSTASRQQLH